MKGLPRLVIGSAAGGLIAGAAFLAATAITPQHGHAHDVEGRDVRVRLRSTFMREAVGRKYLKRCEVTRDSGYSDIEVTCRDVPLN